MSSRRAMTDGVVAAGVEAPVVVIGKEELDHRERRRRCPGGRRRRPLPLREKMSPLCAAVLGRQAATRTALQMARQ